MFFSNITKNQNIRIRESLLWEYQSEVVDYESMKSVIIQRVIERGRIDDFYAIINLYGVNTIKREIKELPYLNDKDIAFVCAVFDMKRENLKCYIKKQSQKPHWNS